MFYRPSNFRLARTHPLAKGLVFAGLGGGAGTLTMLDASGYGRNGTLTNMDPPTDWVLDRNLARWCIDVDGSNDHVTRDVETLSGYDFTLCAWVYLVSRSGWGRILAFTNDSSEAVWMHLNGSDGGLCGGTSGASIDSTGGTPIPTNVWTHVAVTHSNIGYRHRLWVNGAIDRSANINGQWNTLGYPLRVAKQRSDYGLTGRIADPCVYSRELDSTEIGILANPADPMLGGLILPPRRRFWPVTAAASPIWAYRPSRSRVIGGGVA